MSTFAHWAIVELMGHRRLAGYVEEVELFGGKMMRLDVPSDPPATQFYGSSAIYCVTPTTEELARAFAQSRGPRPVERYELPALPARVAHPHGPDGGLGRPDARDAVADDEGEDEDEAYDPEGF